MALGIYDVSARPKARLAGDRSLQVFELTFDTDYAAGGYALDAEDLGFDSIEVLIFDGPVSGFVPEYDRTGGKVKVLYGNYDAADGPLIEVTDGLNGIDGLKVRALVIGIAA